MPRELLYDFCNSMRVMSKHMFMYVFAFLNACVSICVFAFLHIIFVCISVCVFVSVHGHMCIFVCMCI